MVDISVIVNCHNEGRMLHPTVESVRASIEMSRQQGISVELLFVRDRADDSTIYYTDRLCSTEARLLDAEFGDLGLARNYGACAAQGRYLAFIDGDDLWSRNWLVSAYDFAESNSEFSILHTETAIMFDAENFAWRLTGSDSVDFDPSILMTYNPWCPSSFGRREIYLEFPYCPVELPAGFFYEDWHWNCGTLAAGIHHRVVPNTVHCYRSKSVWKEPSLLAAASRTQCTMPPTKFFSLAYQKV